MANEKLDQANDFYQQAEKEFQQGHPSIAYVHMESAYKLALTSYRDDMKDVIAAMAEQRKSVEAYKALAEELAEQAVKIANTALGK